MNASNTEDTPEGEKKPLTLSTNPGTQKPTERINQVRQSFSHGRSKAVTVEVKRRRFAPSQKTLLLDESAQAPEQPPPAVTSTQVTDSPSLKENTQDLTSKLTTGEQEERLRVLKEALNTAATTAQDERLAKEASLRERRDSQAQEQSDAPIQSQAEQQDSILPTDHEEDLNSAATPPLIDQNVSQKKEARHSNNGKVSNLSWEEKKKTSQPKTRRSSTRREGTRTSIFQSDPARTISSDSEGRMPRDSHHKGKGNKKRSSQPATLTQKLLRDVNIPDTVSVKELAARMAEKSADVIKTLMGMGMIATITQMIDGDTAELVVTEMGHRGKRVRNTDLEDELIKVESNPQQLRHRAPVVTIMGHVDHGKTSLLDALRKTSVALGEAGGITQHIGAYQVLLPTGQKITFIDTPGHAAFTEMRARGAQATDIVVLVVAADDGIKDQTIEAIHHAQAANVPMIVAITKVDKPSANSNQVRQMLLNHNVVTEELGGDIQSVEVSATTGFQLDKLEEAILLQAEVLDLKANPDCQADGIVIEAQLKKGLGAVATVLIQNGTLKIGDTFIAGQQYGRVRALIDDLGHKVKKGEPSVPLEVLGFTAPPAAGDRFVVVEDEAKAREIAQSREQRARAQQHTQMAHDTRMSAYLTPEAQQPLKELPLIIKGDAQGSLEALRHSLEKLATDEVKVRILHTGVSGITESDVALARASRALILGFNVRATPQARHIAITESIEIRYYSIIYKAIDEMKEALSGLLDPSIHEEVLGSAMIRQIFSIKKIGKIAGCMVTEGNIRRGAKVRLIRDRIVICESTVKTLRRIKDDVREVREGYECGILLDNYSDIREEDVIECFEVSQISRTL